MGALGQIAPQKATNIMVQLLAAYRGKSLDTFLSQFPVREFEDDNEYTWDVIGSSKRNIPLVEARDENGNPISVVASSSDKNVAGEYLKDDLIGAGTAPFYLVFPEDWFADGRRVS